MTSTSTPSVARDARKLVLKVGSSLVTNEGRGIDLQAVAQWAEQIAGLHAQGQQGVQRAARIQVAAPVGQVFVRQQDLRGPDAVAEIGRAHV